MDGMTIATSDITVGAAKELDVSAGTLTLAAGQLAADRVGAGTFNAGTYSYNGSTISDLGTVTTADIDGGTIDNTAIGAAVRSTIKCSTLDVSGSITPSHNSAWNLGSPSKRFANMYTGDLHLKNERGNWTIFEESDHLRVRNNLTGKMFKMGLTPIEE